MTSFSLMNSVLWNAVIAALLAVLIWCASAIPAIRRRPGLRHCLWIIVLLKLVTPPLFEVSVCPALFKAEHQESFYSQAIPLEVLAPLASGDFGSSVPSAASTMVEPLLDWSLILGLIAGIGTAMVLLRVSIEVVRLNHALRYADVNDQRLTGIAKTAVESMGLAEPILVCVVDANVSPLLWMRFRGPQIVVPRHLADELTDEQLRCVIAHEIAHYSRRDHLTNFLSLVVTACCWWNPVLWWARKELRAAQEACCDALVINRAVASRRTYAETLFQALEFLQTDSSLLPAVASGFGTKSSTQRRFEMIANPHVNHRLAWWSYPVLLAAFALLPCLPGFSLAQEFAEDVSAPSSVVQNDGQGLGTNSLLDPIALDRVVVDSSSEARTERFKYVPHQSKRGMVVHAFERNSETFAWSSEIARSHDGKQLSGQHVLLHTGGGIVTTGTFTAKGNLAIQEIDAETGEFEAECQLELSGISTQRQHAVETAQRITSSVKDQIRTQINSEIAVDQSIADLKSTIQDLAKQQLKLQLQVASLSNENLSQQIEVQLSQKKMLAEQRAAQAAQKLAEESQKQTALSFSTSKIFPDAAKTDETSSLTPSTQVNDALTIHVDGMADGPLTSETATTVWKLLNGDAAVESIKTERLKDKLRIIVIGAGNNHRQIIIESSTTEDPFIPFGILDTNSPHLDPAKADATTIEKHRATTR